MEVRKRGAVKVGRVGKKKGGTHRLRVKDKEAEKGTKGLWSLSKTDIWENNGK